MRLLIGCPVRAREWIIDEYLDHAYDAASKVTDDFGFLFVTPEDDYGMLRRS